MLTPYYLIDADAIRHNLEILRGVMDRTGAHILLAQKAFSCYALYPMIGQYLSGATASGLFEARLCHEEMVSSAKCQVQSAKYQVPSAKLENHIFSPAFRKEDIDEIVNICDHIVFNSIQQLEKYGKKAIEHGCQVGLRINPECSTQPSEHAIYDPCAPGSRLGVTASEFKEWINSPQATELLNSPSLPMGGGSGGRGFFGLHFHTLCEQDSDALETTLNAVVEKFGEWLPRMKWINFGGGHHITRPGYDIARLERCIKRMQDDYGLEVYLEPGEAVALNAGELWTKVLEVRYPPMNSQELLKSPSLGKGFCPPITGEPKGVQRPLRGGLAILDTSAACHMPDVIEMPYRPPLRHSGEPSEKAYTYTLGGPTCLAGDVIGEYSFDEPLKEGDVLVFEDMAIYSMVKNNTFNGMPLPSIYIKEGEESRLWKSFSYDNFKARL